MLEVDRFDFPNRSITFRFIQQFAVPPKTCQECVTRLVRSAVSITSPKQTEPLEDECFFYTPPSCTTSEPQLKPPQLINSSSKWNQQSGADHTGTAARSPNKESTSTEPTHLRMVFLLHAPVVQYLCAAAKASFTAWALSADPAESA
jgi:hypothetical protein